jgi:hypothetical protein
MFVEGFDDGFLDVSCGNAGHRSDLRCLGCSPSGQAGRAWCHHVRLAHPREVGAIEQLQEHIEVLAGMNEGFGTPTSLVWDEGCALIAVDLSALRATMRQVQYDRIIGREDETERNRIAQRVDKTLAHAGAAQSTRVHGSNRPGALPELLSACGAPWRSWLCSTRRSAAAHLARDGAPAPAFAASEARSAAHHASFLL